MRYRNRFQAKSRVALILFACPAIALLLWNFYSSKGTAGLLLSCYVLVATPLFLLVGSYPPFGSRWFWKAMLPIVVLVLVCVYVQVQITDWFQYLEVRFPTRMSFGFTSTVAVLEGWAAWRIVDATEPKRTRN